MYTLIEKIWIWYSNLTDKKRKKVYRFKVRVEGTGRKNRMISNSDTALGDYDIPNKNKWISGENIKSYGLYPLLILDVESG